MSCIPAGYVSQLGVKDTQVAIKKIKDFFERDLAMALNLTRVSAPLFVNSESGLNDNLNGVERAVNFDICSGENIEIVHSLAKWKRLALKEYGFKVGEGLYTDMIAIRRDETMDNIHSMYVDQWDWERIIKKEERMFYGRKTLFVCHSHWKFGGYDATCNRNAGKCRCDCSRRYQKQY